MEQNHQRWLGLFMKWFSWCRLFVRASTFVNNLFLNIMRNDHRAEPPISLLKGSQLTTQPLKSFTRSVFMDILNQILILEEQQQLAFVISKFKTDFNTYLCLQNKHRLTQTFYSKLNLDVLGFAYTLGKHLYSDLFLL